MKGETIFDRLRKGIPVGRDDPEIDRLDRAFDEASKLRMEYNSAGLSRKDMRGVLAKIVNSSVQDDTVVIPPFFFDLGFNIHLGKHDIINYDVVMLDCAEITIGDNVAIGAGAKLITASHPKDHEMREKNPFMTMSQPIVIGNNAWIGAGAIILPGIKIGDDAIVGAGAVVTHDVPAGETVVGNPARPIKR